MLTSTAELILSVRPDRAFMVVDELPRANAYLLALEAVEEARKKMPKLSGRAADRLEPIYADNIFGILWQDSYVWYQDHGIRPFTMNNLQGKTIPMWINDPSGQLRQKNPKAKTRVTKDGRQQTLIFRKAPKQGGGTQRYSRNSKTGALELNTDKKGSSPTKAGRAKKDNLAGSLSEEGRKSGGKNGSGSSGMGWRYPGIAPKLFINNSITVTAQKNGILPVRIYVTDATWNGRVPND